MVRLLKALFAPRSSLTLDTAAWEATLALPVFFGLAPPHIERLHALARALLADKTFSGAAGLEVDAGMATRVAAFAALPVLALGLEAYDDFREIILYPGEFLHAGEEIDEAGVVHPVRHIRSGEAMQGGPIVLSWEDVLACGMGEGYNVVIHEFAHKLDMRNGELDGLPPLPPDMPVHDWAAAFQPAYAALVARLDAEEEWDGDGIDPYAGESPSECFAVMTEYFFEAPDLLHEQHPAVYQQLARYFRQDPLARLEIASP